MEHETPTVGTLDEMIRRLAEGTPDRAVQDLTAVANRAVIELHKIAREQARDRRGAPEWGQWAKLANAARSGVLQVAAIRDSVKGLGTPEASAAPSGETE